MKKSLLTLLLSIMLSIFLVPIHAAGDSTYTVTYLDWNGKLIDRDVVDSGQSAYFLTHIRIGYEFVGWGYDASTLNNSVLVDVTEDRTAYAIYKPNDYQVQFLDEAGNLVLNTVMQRDSVVLPLTDELLNKYPESTVIPVDHETYETVVLIREDVYMNDTTLLYLEETNFELKVTVVPIPAKDGFRNQGYGVDLIKGDTVFYPLYEEIPVIVPPIVSEFTYQVEQNHYKIINFIDNLQLLEEQGDEVATLPIISADSFYIDLTRDDLLKLRQTVTTLILPFSKGTMMIPPGGIVNWVFTDFSEVSIEVTPSELDSFLYNGLLAEVKDGFQIRVLADGNAISHYLTVEIPNSPVLINQELEIEDSHTEYQASIYQVVTLSEVEMEEVVEPDPSIPQIIDLPEDVGPTVLEQIDSVREDADQFVIENLYYIPVVIAALFAVIFAGVAILDKK